MTHILKTFHSTFNSADKNIYRRGLVALVTYDALSPESSEYFLSLLLKPFLRAPLGVHIQKSVEIYTSRMNFLLFLYIPSKGACKEDYRNLGN